MEKSSWIQSQIPFCYKIFVVLQINIPDISSPQSIQIKKDFSTHGFRDKTNPFQTISLTPTSWPKASDTSEDNEANHQTHRLYCPQGNKEVRTGAEVEKIPRRISAGPSGRIICSIVRIPDCLSEKCSLICFQFEHFRELCLVAIVEPTSQP